MNPACLYIVATPIGNLADISERAVQILQKVDLIAVEDTRHSGKLLQHIGVATPMTALHEHNESRKVEQLIERLSTGESIALISDAGTPLISDPGYQLVKAALAAEIKVSPIPGASALVAALSVSGLPSDAFIFEGFLPNKSAGRLKKLGMLADESRTLIFYEAPHRIVACLQDMQQVFGAERKAVVARELTKTFETIKNDSLGNLLVWIEADANQQRGEFVLLIQGKEKEPSTVDTEAEFILETLMQELPLKQASQLAAKITGIKKNTLYQIGLNKKQ
ncbi:MAG: 16S rRNA (cytidine(1402)-2'-O)-methyltransferase [SAR86 cluster bacterium]|uniref:Ribosomal RNA small subunit methyltransferase I n=1 Tax=SAR86 cluster bacterium TaxID=2030880 RepID=A0A2A5C9W0_9GAMM|nr:16S rRNA (cytidine(1402)-2'-O)-methyltransferase [bacterium AH-315-I11]PCJ40649.1 MAG: 16S rRNA (cytidine(1402)-2'-O)-methyltransferase [SAR86 cluster bacterium]